MLLATFLDVGTFQLYCCLQGQTALRFHQKYLHLCSEDDLTGLKPHEGELLMTEFPFGVYFKQEIII